MSTDELRKAAETLRGRAGALRDHADSHGEITGGSQAWWSASFLANAIAAHAPGSTDDRDLGVLDEHFGLAGDWFHLMHPGVGLALADLLDHHADDHGSYECDGMKQCPSATVARLINGGAA